MRFYEDLGHLGVFGRPWGVLRASLGRTWGVFVHLYEDFGRHLVRLGASLGASLDVFGRLFVRASLKHPLDKCE